MNEKEFKQLLEMLTFEPDHGQSRSDQYGNFEPGTVLKTASDIYLIGHANPLLGVCDDCNIKDEPIIGIANISQLFR